MLPCLPGENCIWLQEHRGGYGYISRVLATFIRLSETSKRALIEVRTNDGEVKRLWVKPNKLERAKPAVAQRTANNAL